MPAVSNRFFFLQLRDIQSEENIRGCGNTQRSANGESNVAGKIIADSRETLCRRESIFSGARGEKRIPQASKHTSECPEGNGHYYNWKSTHGETKTPWLPDPKPAAPNQGSRRLWKGVR